MAQQKTPGSSAPKQETPKQETAKAKGPLRRGNPLLATVNLEAPANAAPSELSRRHLADNYKRSYLVRRLGKDVQPETIIDGCCDESEAIRAYCLVYGIESRKCQFRVTPAGDCDPHQVKADMKAKEDAA